MYDLKGKVALVTGVATERGIGHRTAVCLAQEGAAVVVADLAAFSKGLDIVVEEIEQCGGQGLAVAADVTSEQQVNKMVEQALAKFHKVDILVNSHGMQGPLKVPVADYLEEDWNRVLDVNLTGTFLCCRAVARDMVRRNKGGKIVNVASRAGKIGRPGHAAYSASKFGVIGLTQSLALELAPYEINVNAVCPNMLPTGFSRGDEIESIVNQKGISYDEAANIVFAEVIRNIPMGRLGTVQDIANMILFLASSQSDYVTGQSINVNGGMLMS